VSYKPVPVEEACQIAVKYDKRIVVILSHDSVYQLMHTTTYGVTAYDKEQAAAVGALVTQRLGGDLSKKTMFEDFHQNYDPARLREAAEILQEVRSHQGITGVLRERIAVWCEGAKEPT